MRESFNLSSPASPGCSGRTFGDGLKRLPLPLNHRPGGGQLSPQTKGKGEKPQSITVPRGILENPAPVKVIKRNGVKVGLERAPGRRKVPVVTLNVRDPYLIELTVQRGIAGITAKVEGIALLLQRGEADVKRLMTAS